MSQKIDSLLVELGLDTDVQSFRQGEAVFNSVRSAALQFATVVGGGLGMQQLTFGFAQHYDQMGRYANRLDLSAQYASNLEYALGQVGGTAGDAQGALETMTSLLDGIMEGDTSALAQAQRWGLDSSVIMGAQDAADAMERLSLATASMDNLQLRNVLDALGLGSMFNLFDAGPETFQGLMQEAQRLRPVARNMVDTAQDFNTSLSKLTQAVGGVSDEISERILPDISDSLDAVAEWLADNRESLGAGFEEALPYIKATAAGIGVLVAARTGAAGVRFLGGAGVLGPVMGLAAGYAFMQENPNHLQESGDSIRASWNNYRRRFLREAEEALGRELNLPAWMVGEQPDPAVSQSEIDALQDFMDSPARPSSRSRQPSAVDAAWSDLMRSGIDLGADTWIPDIHPETLDSIQELLDREIPGGIGGDFDGHDLLPEELFYEPSPEELIPPGNRSELREGNLRQMRHHFPEQYMGNVTFHIHGATDPQGVAREVERRIREYAAGAARNWREPIA